MKILVTGSESGLGEAIAHQLEAGPFGCHEVVRFDHKLGNDVRWPEEWVYAAPDVDALINCAGVNAINYLENVNPFEFSRVMDTNAYGIFAMTKWLLPVLSRNKGTVVNIVSNAAHMPMTGSLAYNASKAAAHIMTLQLARELGPRHGITVFGVAPNKLAGTGMSRYIEEAVPMMRGWTPEEARTYQLKSLPAGEETDPNQLAEFIAYLLQDREHHKFLQGCILPYGA